MGCGVWFCVVEGNEGFGGVASPSGSRLWSWLNCSANSVRDSSMVSVRGTDSEKRRLKFFILFMISPEQPAGPEAAVRTASRENREWRVSVFPPSSVALHGEPGLSLHKFQLPALSLPVNPRRAPCSWETRTVRTHQNPGALLFIAA